MFELMLSWATSVLLFTSLIHISYGDGVLFNEMKPVPSDSPRERDFLMDSAMNAMIQTYNRHEIPRKVYAVNGTNATVFESLEIPPLLVDVNMFVYSFSSISVVDMDYTIDFLLRQRWQDDRLQIIAPPAGKRKPISYLKDHIWLPDLFFRNAKNGFLHTITKPNYLIWLDSNGVITFSQKLSLKVSCHMTLEKFPMDTQSCKVNIGSYGYALDYLDFRWWRSEVYKPTDGLPTNDSAKKAIEIRSDLEINEFNLISYDAYYCAMQYSSTGQFSCLEVRFDLQRRFGFYLIYAYLPSMLIVVIAWVSFLLDSSAVPARVSIGLLCVLALITQSAAILTQLPRVSYVKAIDLWVFICLAFVVSSLLEFAAANTISRRQSRRKAKVYGIEQGLQVVTTLSALNALLGNNEGENVKRNRGEKLLETPGTAETEEAEPLNSGSNFHGENRHSAKDIEPNAGIKHTFSVPEGAVCTSDCPCNVSSQVHRLDLTFAIGYPILFILFNIAYWTYYVYYKRHVLRL